MRIAKEEIFGPVLAVCKFNEEKDAITFANDTPYGLAAYCFTKDISRSWRVSQQLEAGVIGANTTNMYLVPAPFGGIKESGIGREGGIEGIDEFLEIKTINMNLFDL